MNSVTIVLVILLVGCKTGRTASVQGSGGDSTPADAFPVTIFEEILTWEEANADCESRGGRLLTLKTEEDYEEKADLLRQLGSITGGNGDKGWVWLGGKSDGESAPWHWTS